MLTCGEIFNSLGKHPYITKRIPSTHCRRILSLQRVIDAIFVAIAQKGMGILINHHTMTYVWTIVSLMTIIGVVLVFILKKAYPNIK